MLPSSFRKIAVALKYKYSEDRVPKVVATGEGLIAESIIRKAKEAGIPIQEDKKLAVLLKKVEVGEPIPAELYQLVAELIAMVYRMDSKLNPATT